jgi:hypothetical protein
MPKTSPAPFDFDGLSEQTPLIKKIKDGLTKAAGQSIPYVTINKPKRVAGASTKAVDFGLENGQVVSFIIRQQGDVMRIAINGKDAPMAGDLSPEYAKTFNAALAEIADAIRKAQAAFDKKKSQEKVAIPQTKDEQGRRPPQNTTQQIKKLVQDEALLDEKMAQKTEARDLLKQQVDTMGK